MSKSGAGKKVVVYSCSTYSAQGGGTKFLPEDRPLLSTMVDSVESERQCNGIWKRLV